MVGGVTAALVGDAVRSAFSNPSLWVIALCLVGAEAGCNAQARCYPDGVAADVRFDGATLTADGQAMGQSFEDSSLFIHNGSVFVADGVALITGQRNASGAEAIGAVLGTWAAALPTALLLLVVGAWLLPGYYRNQVGDGRQKKSFRPGTALFRRVLAVRAMTALAMVGAACLGAIPGLALLVVAGAQHLTPLAVIGALVTVGGTLAGWLYVQAGVLFADREAVLAGLAPMEAMRRSWSRARGRRLRRLTWTFGAWTIEAIGSLGWLAWFVGFFTHPIARTVSDILLTRLYVEEASHA